MKVDVFYLKGCRSAPLAFELIKQIVAEQNIDACVTQVEVTDMAAPRDLRFFGSPTIQVNGLDIDPAARKTTGFVFG